MNNIFFKVDFALLQNTQAYQNLDPTCMLMYFLYRNRQQGSFNSALKGDRRYVDDLGKCFIYFANEEMAKLIHTSAHTVTNARKKLAELGLIKVVRNGMKNYRIYVNDYQHQAEPEPQPVQVAAPLQGPFGQATQPAAVQSPAPATTPATINERVAEVAAETAPQTDDFASIFDSYNPRQARIQKIFNEHETPVNQQFHVVSDFAGHDVQNVNTSKITELDNKYIKTDMNKSINASVDETMSPQSDFDAEDSDLGFQRVPASQLAQTLNISSADEQQVVKTYGDMIGFVTNSVRRSLLYLIRKADAQMVTFAIKISSEHHLTNPIAYITKVILNALHDGSRTVADMRYKYYTTEKVIRASFEENNASRERYRKLVREMKDSAALKEKSRGIIPIFKIEAD